LIVAKKPSLLNNGIPKNENTNRYKKHNVAAIGTENIIKKNILNILEINGMISDAGKPATSFATFNAAEIG
jgi:hypothetical protein